MPTGWSRERNLEQFGPYNPWQPRVPKGVPEGGEWRPYRTSQVIWRGFMRGLRGGADDIDRLSSSLIDMLGEIMPQRVVRDLAGDMIEAFREEEFKVAGRRQTAMQVRARRMRKGREATGPESLGFKPPTPTARRI